MTPTPTLLLFVALFWTLPASAAAYLYRRNGNSFEDLATRVQQKLRHIASGLEEQRRDAQTVEA